MILRRRIMVTGGGDIGGYVDLGLPSGILWAVGNLVKDSQGNYSIGGETDWGTYVSWGNIDGHNEGEGYNFNDNIYNTTPGKQVAADIPKDDSAHDICLARLGAPWNLPKKEDFQELYYNTDSEWVADYNGTGVAGRKFMKKTDHSVYVFFPASGVYVGTSLGYRGAYGYYWSSSFYSDTRAYCLFFLSSGVNPQNDIYRRNGFTVRPVCKPMFSITITLTGDSVEGITVTVRDSEGISHSGTTNSNGVVKLTGVVCGNAKVFTKDYYVTNGHIIVNASSRTFTCGLEQRESLESKYLTFYSITDCTHKFTNAVNYSLNGGITWQSLAANTGLTVTAGNSVMWKATLTPNSSSGIGTFSVTDTSMRFDVEGNPMSLLYEDNFIGQTNLSTKSYAFYELFKNNKGVVDAQNMALPATTLAQYCYNSMFFGCTSLTTVPELPATTLANYCYSSMFYNCTSLTAAPSLPATTLANNCYNSMFNGCTSLTTAPELPATTLAIGCYQNMFDGCENLTTAPQLPATTLATYCYSNMFSNCTKLTTAPQLPATTLAFGCYSNMFRGCTSLTTAPVLSATTLTTQCYSNMFRGCTSLTTAPMLPATTLADYCYYYMFYGCSNLNSITCLATNISATNCTTGWVNGVAASGTFTKAASMSSWTTGNSGIPSGWRVQNA